MTRSIIAPVLLLVALTACGGDGADTEAGDAASSADAPPAASGELQDDVAALEDYELSMDRIDRLFAAQMNLARAASRMTPAEQAELAASGSSENATLDDMVANLERHPAARQAVSDAGISARDYAMTMMAMMQASMAMSVLAMRPNDDQDSLANAMQTNPANIRFIRENMEAITQKQQAAATEMERLFPEGAEAAEE